MQKQLSILKIMFVTLFSFFSLTFINAQDFDFTVTDANMTIQVSAEICSSVMDEGDLLGAFFTNPSGDLQCAGFQTFSGDQLAIAVMASESGLFNGYATGDNFQWAFYDQSESATVLLDSEMNSSPPFSSTFIANGFGQILSLSVSTGVDCEDSDSVYGMSCSVAVGALGCSFDGGAGPISDFCPVTCDTCDGGSAPVLGCTNSDALNYDSSATEDDGSCIILGCTCEIAINYNADATLDDSSCVVLSGCADPTAENYSGDTCSSNSPINDICEYAPVDVSIGPFEYVITDANMTVQVSGSAATWNGGAPPPNGSLIGAFFTNNNGVTMRWL